MNLDKTHVCPEDRATLRLSIVEISPALKLCSLQYWIFNREIHIHVLALGYFLSGYSLPFKAIL